jgi:hypothetical protein
MILARKSTTILVYSKIIDEKKQENDYQFDTRAVEKSF